MKRAVFYLWIIIGLNFNKEKMLLINITKISLNFNKEKMLLINIVKISLKINFGFRTNILFFYLCDILTEPMNKSTLFTN